MRASGKKHKRLVGEKEKKSLRDNKRFKGEEVETVAYYATITVPHQ